MSSSDIFDVLNIKHKSKSPAGTSSPVPSGSFSAVANARASKPQVTGMQRELYNLLGENQPPIMTQPTSKFKEKLKSIGKPSPWTHTEFKANPHLTLNHWVKGSKELIGEEPQESSFAKFNQHISLPEFTKEEYESFMGLSSTDKNVQPKDIEKESTTTDSADNEEVNVTVKDESIKDNKDESSKEEDNKDESSANEPENTELAAGSVEALEEDKESSKESEKAKDSEEDKITEAVKEKEDTVTDPVNKADNDEWTFEEIDYLFKLCKNYDLRWYIINDRYNFGKANRTLEQLKDKFYSVSKKYFKSKNAADPLIASLDFPIAKENERKKYLQRLLSRSAAEIAEEEALIIESRKFEMAAKKMLTERESLLRLLDSPNSDKSVSQFLTSQGISQLYSSLLSDKGRKRKHESGVPENPWMKQQQQFAQQKQQLQQLHERKTESGIPDSGDEVDDGDDGDDSSASPRRTKKQKLEQQTAMKRKTEVAYAEKLLKDFNEEEKKSLGITMHGEKLTPGVFLRSTKISTFKPALQNKVVGTLQELKLPARPAMPSRDVVQKQEELLKHIVTLIDLKKNLDKMDAEKAIVQ